MPAWTGSCGGSTAQRLTFRPEDGLEVVAVGRITTYPSRSRYQLIVDRLEPAGVGALMALLEERRKKLAAEGLFAPERKRPLPFLPEVIGVVTSPSGAVLQDILHRLAERFPRRVLLWPVLVQGEFAAEQVAAAIQGFNRLVPGGAVPRPDVLIVARGGGSLEDLWAFNEEVVVRAAAASAIPLDLGGRPRDRYHADRPRRRPARADAHGRGRARGAGARRARPAPRPARPAPVPWRWSASCASSASGSRASAAACPTRRRCSARRASGSTIWPSACPMPWTGRLERCALHVRGLALRLRSPAQLLQDTALRLMSQADRLAYQLRGLLRDHGRQLERLAARLTLDELALRLERHAHGARRPRRAPEPRRGAAPARGAASGCAALASRLASVSYESVLAARLRAGARRAGGAGARCARARSARACWSSSSRTAGCATVVAARPARRAGGEPAGQGRLL